MKSVFINYPYILIYIINYQFKVKSQIYSFIMNEENIQNELKEIGQKLDRIGKLNNNILTTLTILVIILIILVFMCFIYFSGHFPPI